MKLKILNTKTHTSKMIDLEKAEKEYFCETFTDNHCTRNEYNSVLGELEGKEKADYVRYWMQSIARVVYDDYVEYVKDMIEYVTWTSPTGITPINKVIEVIK